MEENAIQLGERYTYRNEGKQSSGILKNEMKEWVCINDNKSNILVWVKKSDIKKLETAETEFSNN